MPSSNGAAADVVVIGGGVIGLAIAWRAAERGLNVTVLERATAGGGTSWVAAGMLGPIAEAAAGEEPLLALGQASAAAYPSFISDLARASARADVGYTPCGTLLTARDGDEAEALVRELELRQRLGLRVQRLRASEARRREPALAPSLRLALDVPDDHAIDARKLTQVLSAAVGQAGGEVREHARAVELLVAGGRVRGVGLADGERVMGNQVVIAAGVWSTELAGLPPHDAIPIRPVKGQILRLHDPAGPGLLSRVVRRGGVYIVPRGDGRYVIGGTMEERGFDTTVTAGAVFELLRDATELVPGVSELVLDECSAGLRPGTPDNLPVIGRGDVDGLYWATGHRRGGILLAPITAELVVGALAGEPMPEPAAAFAPGRFARAPVGSLT